MMTVFIVIIITFLVLMSIFWIVVAIFSQPTHKCGPGVVGGFLIPDKLFGIDFSLC